MTTLSSQIVWLAKTASPSCILTTPTASTSASMLKVMAARAMSARSAKQENLTNQHNRQMLNPRHQHQRKCQMGVNLDKKVKNVLRTLTERKLHDIHLL